MGNVFRRYWLPVCSSAQLAKPDGDPLRVTLVGERLVAFRDSNGKVGVLDELCPHRGASLALGRVEECGIRCLYHGWKFAVDGTVLDTPNNRDESFKKRVKARAYPVREEGGLVWTYLGPAEKLPAFTRYAFMDVPDEHRTVLRVNVKANYLQLLEGGFDSSHVGILHSNVARPGWIDNAVTRSADETNPANLSVDDNAPTLDPENTDFGFYYAAFRQAGDAKGTINVRVVPFIMPSTRIIPAPTQFYTVFETPADDESTSTFLVIHGQAPVDRERVKALLGLDDPRCWSEKDCEFKLSWADRFGQDRQRMKENWTGLRGVEQEDAVISLSMGPIFDRSKEHLVPADKAVVRVRQRLLESARTVEQGGDPVGVGVDLADVGAPDVNVAADTNWRTIVPHHGIPTTNGQTVRELLKLAS
jgi:phenylpropionate dioxygenase-like ring-hydroxylating dioxygenase large terminal subunit